MTSKTVSRLGLICVAGLMLGGCAFGQKITYSNTTADVDAKGNKTVAVATHDQRPYVVSANKAPAFVGISRGGYGNPFDVETPTNAPLSDEISESVSRSLSERGFKATTFKTTATQGRHAVIDGMTATGSERLVLITLKEFKTDKYMRTSMLQDVTVKVFDKAGEELATATFTSDEVVGDVQLAFRASIEKWFSDPKIVSALK